LSPSVTQAGSGFHPDLTGAENILINASVIGLSRRHQRIVGFKSSIPRTAIS
jgi:ABC-type polysaccharide/polyol phosphate transport system ATPase subunit